MSCLLLRTSDDPELRMCDRDEQLCTMTGQASQYFETGDFTAAQRAYRAILEEFCDDAVVSFMLGECEKPRARTAKPAAA
jgi:hypothetical protein